MISAPGAARARAGLRDDDRGPATRRVAPGATSPWLPRAIAIAVTAPEPTASAPRCPTTLRACPPHGPSFDHALGEGLRGLGLGGLRAASEAAVRSYEAHARLLAAGTGPSTSRPSATPRRSLRHVCDSLTAVAILEPPAERRPPSSTSGAAAAIPGLPLAAALPWRRVGARRVGRQEGPLPGRRHTVRSSAALVDGGLDAPAIEVIDGAR